MSKFEALKKADPEVFAAVVKAFLETPFEGGRHARRVEKMKDLER